MGAFSRDRGRRDVDDWFALELRGRQRLVGPAISYALGQGSTMVGALWGVLVWREFAGGGARVNRLLVLMFVLFVDRPWGGFHRAALCGPTSGVRRRKTWNHYSSASMPEPAP